MNYGQVQCLGPRILVLLGLGFLAGGFPTAFAGQPIKFSSPEKQVERPSSTDPLANLPQPKWKWNVESPSASIPPAQPLIFIDPKAEKLLREQREQRRNWLSEDPALFRDKSQESAEPRKNAIDDAFKRWDVTTERVFGKPLEEERSEEKASGPETPRFSDNWLVEAGLGNRQPLGATREEDLTRARRDGEKHSTREPGQESELRDPFKDNSSEAAMKALFDGTSNERLPMLPGMSISDLLGTGPGRTKAQKREQEERRADFNRMLAPREPPGVRTTDAVGIIADQTRSPINPILPMSVNDALPARSTVEPIVPPNLAGKLAAPKLPFDEVISRSQPMAPVAAKETKTRQMESLKLMSRPSVLSFPSHQF
jgi:hypothetical protein